MPIINQPELYEAVKQHAATIYPKSSAYRSGWIVKTYKSLGGTYSEDNKPKKLKTWFKEKWQNVANENQYPVLRPTVRVNERTPLTVAEIDPSNLKKQISFKQKIRGVKNLSPFKEK